MNIEKLDKEFNEKIKTFTMFKQLCNSNIKGNREELAKRLIVDYTKCLHRYWKLPDTDDIVKVAIVSALTDIKFEGDYIVFLKNDGTEWLRVFAPC